MTAIREVAASATAAALPTLDVQGVDVTIDGTEILRDVSCRMPSGRFTGVIGPNGSGKSTLLAALTRWRAPDGGRVMFDDRDVRSIRRRELARIVAEVEQHSETVLELSVEQIVELGTIPRAAGRGTALSAWGRPPGEAVEEADRAIETVGVGELRHRTWQTLSGGERQKVQVARALAQDPQVLVLDEPTNHLDVAAGLTVLNLVRSLDLTVVAALHDLNLAAAYCDHLVVLRDGRVHAEGSPAEVLTPTLLADVYGLDAEVSPHPRTGAPMVVVCGVAEKGR